MGLFCLLSGSHQVQPGHRCAVGRIWALWRQGHIQCGPEGNYRCPVGRVWAKSGPEGVRNHAERKMITHLFSYCSSSYLSTVLAIVVREANVFSESLNNNNITIQIWMKLGADLVSSGMCIYKDSTPDGF